ncbi:MAG TPA: phage tail tube protein [Xanthobacteraceae bacterium]|nr:phage tail tube protein [Xanthobacteraceae bacterium]
MGSTNRSASAYVAEVTPGVTPASPAMKAIRLTSSGLKFSPNRTESNELQADRQVADQILVGLTNEGPIGNELSFQAFDDFLEATFQGTWANKPYKACVNADTEISDLSTTTATVDSGGAAFKAGMLVLTNGFATPGNNGILSRVASSSATTVVFPASSFTAEASVPAGAYLRVVGFQGASGDLVAVADGITSTSLDFTTLGLNVGEWVKIGGDIAGNQFATAGCNGWAQIKAIAANKLTFNVLPPSWATDAGTGKTVQVFAGDQVKNGVTQRSFTIERQQQDLVSPSYEYFRGCQFDKFSATVKANAVIDLQFDVVGLGASAGTVRASGATDVAAPTFPVMNSASNILELIEGGSPITGPSFVMELGFQIANNLAGQPAVASLSSVGIRNGEFSVSGPLTAYFGDLTLLNKVLNDTPSSLMFRAGYAASPRQSYVFDVPYTKISGDSPVTAKNTDRMFNGTYSASKHPTMGYTAAVGRYWYLPASA